MSEKKMAIYAKAMGRIQPEASLNNQLMARVGEDADAASEIVLGTVLQPNQYNQVLEIDKKHQRVSAPWLHLGGLSSKAAVQTQSAGWWRNSRTVAVAASVMMVLMLTLGSYFMVLTPVTWVDVDINPSVELGLNRIGRVVTAEGVNEDGEAVMKQVSLIGTKPEKAVQAVVETATRMGYIKENEPNVVALTVIADKPEKEETLAVKVRTGADEGLQNEGVTAEIVEQAMTPERVQRAQTLQNEGYDVSPGKLNLIEKLDATRKAAGAAGVTLEPFVEEDLYTAPVKKIQEQTNFYRKAMKEQGETGKSAAPGQLKQDERDKNKGDDDMDDQNDNEGENDNDNDLNDPNGNQRGKTTAPGQLKKGVGSESPATDPSGVDAETAGGDAESNNSEDNDGDNGGENGEGNNGGNTSAGSGNGR